MPAMRLPEQPTRTPITDRRYRQRGTLLIARCRRDLALPDHEDLDPRRLVGWLARHRPTWSRHTWRQYKAAVMHLLAAFVDRDGAVQEAMSALHALGSEGCLRRGTRTSASKLKRFPAQDRQRLIDRLAATPSTWSDDLARWLRVGALVGLRPDEWGESWVLHDQGRPVLRVRNAKVTNGRAHGPFRHLLLSGLSDHERADLETHVARARDFINRNQPGRMTQGCAQLLAKTARIVWPRRTRYPTLYSLRHQFAADAKASGLTLTEIAALMGHAVDATSVAHYGRRQAGMDLVRVQAPADEVARIRRPQDAARHNGQRLPRTHPTPPRQPSGA